MNQIEIYHVDIYFRTKLGENEKIWEPEFKLMIEEDMRAMNLIGVVKNLKWNYEKQAWYLQASFLNEEDAVAFKVKWG